MTTLLAVANPFWTWLTRAAWQAGVLVLLVLAVQWLFRKQLAPRWRCALWWLVVVRLVLPVSPGSSVSIFNWIGWRAKPIAVTTDSAASLTQRETTKGDPPVTLGLNPPRWRNSLPVEVGPQIQRKSIPPTPATLSATSTTVAVRSGSTFSWRAAFIRLWFGGVALLAAHLGWSVLRLQGELRRAQPVTDASALDLLDRCRREVRVRRRLSLLETSAVTSPALCGLFRPRLLLPPGLIGHFTERELRFVFLHELAHLKRHDIAANWLTTLLQLLHWFNPLVWLAFARMRADRELACDALALAHAQADENRAYGATIIKLLEGFTRPAAMPGLIGILEDKSQMKRRITMIARFKKSPRWSVLGMVLLAAAGLVGLTDAQTKPRASSASAIPAVAANEPSVIAKTKPVANSSELSASAKPTGSAETNALQRRFFIVDPNALARAFHESQGQFPAILSTNWATLPFELTNPSLSDMDYVTKYNNAATLARFDKLKQLLATMGVDLSPPKQHFFSERKGMLMVKATSSDLDTIEKAVQVLNMAPAQLTIEARFVEVRDDEQSGMDFLKALGFDPRASTPAPVTSQSLPNARSPATPGDSLTNISPAAFTGILTPPQFRTVLALLKKRDGVDLLSMPTVTTLSGRQAQIKTVDVRYVVTGLQANQQQGAPLVPITEPFETGPVLDVIPAVSADGYTIQMTVIPTVKEFLGYDDPGSPPTPQPRFRVRQVSTTATLWDGQTLVLSAGTIEEVKKTKDQVPVLGNLPLAEKSFQSESKASRRKSLFIFITPTIIDPAGNPVHTPEEMPFRDRAVPPPKSPR